MALRRMDNVGIVVEDLEGTIDFLSELGLELEGRTTIEGEWAGRVTGLGDQHVEIAMMRTPDGHSRLLVGFESTSGRVDDLIVLSEKLGQAIGLGCAR
jgi:catechol 2,3-dioxygenase-like lactoylglutathione lyase family enzyme